MKKAYCFFALLLTLLYVRNNACAEEKKPLYYYEEQNHGNLKIACTVFGEHKDAAAKLIAQAEAAYDFFTNIYGNTFDTNARSIKIKIIETSELGTAQDGWEVAGQAGYRTIELNPDIVEAYKQGRKSSVIAHEVSHLWWGASEKDMTEMWFTEGLAYFSEHYFQAKSGLEDSTKNYFDITMDYIADESAESNDIPLSELTYNKYYNTNDWDDKTILLAYEKGSYIFEMLRASLGDEQFFSVMRNFYSKYDALTSENLAKEIRKTTGKNFDWFFKQWICKAGYPKLQFKYQVKSENGSQHLVVSIIQTGDIYRLQLPLVVESDQGSLEYSLDVNSQTNNFDYVVKGKITNVLLDPANSCLKRVDGDVYDLACKALEALDKSESKKAIELLENALKQNPPSLTKIYSILVKANKKQGNYEKAFLYTQKLFEERRAENPAHAFKIGDTVINDVRAAKFDDDIYLADLALDWNLYDQAGKLYQNCIDSLPSLAELQLDLLNKFILSKAYNGLGRIALNNGDYEVAREKFSLALQNDASLFGARMDRAKANLKLKKYDDALSDCDYLIENKTSLSEAELARIYLLRGRLFDLSNRRKDAMESYTEVIKLDADDSEIKKAKAGISKPLE